MWNKQKVHGLQATTWLPKTLLPCKERSGKWFFEPSGQNGPSDDPRREDDPDLEARGARRRYGSAKLGGKFSQLSTSKNRGGQTSLEVPKPGITSKVIPRKHSGVSSMGTRSNKEPLTNLLATPLDQSTQERSGLVVSEATTITP